MCEECVSIRDVGRSLNLNTMCFSRNSRLSNFDFVPAIFKVLRHLRHWGLKETHRVCGACGVLIYACWCDVETEVVYLRVPVVLRLRLRLVAASATKHNKFFSILCPLDITILPRTTANVTPKNFRIDPG